jgi:hypothetical protein
MTDEQQQSSSAQTEAAPEPEAITFAEFLESVPPSQARKVTGLWEQTVQRSGSTYVELQTPPTAASLHKRYLQRPPLLSLPYGNQSLSERFQQGIFDVHNLSLLQLPPD